MFIFSNHHCTSFLLQANCSTSSPKSGTSSSSRSRKPGAIIESFVNHAPGVFSGTFSGIKKLSVKSCHNDYLHKKTHVLIYRLLHFFKALCTLIAKTATDVLGVISVPSCRSSTISWVQHGITRACPPPLPNFDTRPSAVHLLLRPPPHHLHLQLLVWQVFLPKLPLCLPAAPAALCRHFIHWCSARARSACASPLVRDTITYSFCWC